MAKRPVKRAQRAPLEPPRSPKAGSPSRAGARSPQARRRQKSAHSSLSKGTTIFETDHGPRAAWPASPAKRKKR
jgi:hypothetical protein